MNFFDVLDLICGLSLFLFGMQLMSSTLEKKAGGQLKSILERLTKNPLRGFFLGLAVTAIIQSSSATTVMVVGFVNSGLMSLKQSIRIIMGANIGTCVTAWVLSLTGLAGSEWYIQLLSPSFFVPLCAFIGIILFLFVKNEGKNQIGLIFLGFATLMTGMDIMSVSVAGLENVPQFTGLLTAFQNPILGVIAGALLTAIIQSSSASIGILQAISATGKITYGAAVPIIMGQNIGTCVTAMISSVGTNKNARRAALAHLYFNIMGTVILLFAYFAAENILGITHISDLSVDSVSIAATHTVFNILSTIILYPFAGVLERMSYYSIPDKKMASTQ